MTSPRAFHLPLLLGATCLITAVAACAPPPNAPARQRAVQEHAVERAGLRDEALNRPQRQRIQRILNALGYSAGAPDGVIGNRSRQAIQQYQADKGITPDGRVTRSLLASLNADARSQGVRIRNRPARQRPPVEAAVPTETPTPSPQTTTRRVESPPETTTTTEPTFTRRRTEDIPEADSSGGGWN